MSSEEKGLIYIVDDHIEMAKLLGRQLGGHGFAVETFEDARSAIEQAGEVAPSLVITDLRMKEVDGLDLLDAVHGISPEIDVIIMTAFGEIETAVDAIKRGAFHYVAKPFELEEILLYVERAFEGQRIRREHRALRRMALDRSSLENLVGVSRAMSRLRDVISRVAATDASVLIRGESGSGKELVARALHYTGLRHEGPFVPVNCTVLPDTLLESELFGHVEGAFTGASKARNGLFLEADGGTIFLDEIGDMDADLQTKLLRVLEEGMIRPLGSDAQISVDVRVVAATHQNIEELIERGEFRSDLFFRLDVVPIRVPSLRERPMDIPLLVKHFVEESIESHPRTRVERFDPELIEVLTRQRWPGNVRQLKNAVERLVVLGEDSVADVSTFERIQTLDESRPFFQLGSDPDELRSMRELTDAYIEWVLDLCGGNKTRAASILDIDASTIYRRMRDSEG